MVVFLWFQLTGKKKVEEAIPLKDFYIETMSVSNTGRQSAITKNAKIEWISEITISAQTPGRVTSLSAQVWSTIKKWSPIANLEDTQWSTIFRWESSSLAVNSAQNSYEVQRKNLEKQIDDLLLAKERAELNYTNTAWGEVNNTSLQIAGLQKNLEKARLDYNTKLNNDDTTLQNNITSAKNIYSDTFNLLIDVIDQWDRLLGVTDANRKLASDYDIYLGGRSIDVRKEAEDQLWNLLSQRSQLEKLGNNITSGNINNFLDQYKSIVSWINWFTVSMKDVFANSLEDSRYLPKAKLEALTASFGWLQSKASWIISSITAQSNALWLFIESYKPAQESLAKQIEVLENDILVKQTQLEEAAKNSEITLKWSEGNYNFAVDTKNLNLQTIENTLAQAQIALREAQFNVQKLYIQSPIVGTISDVFVDIWQEVTIGTPIARIVSEWKWVKIGLSEKEVQWIEVGWSVTLVSETSTWVWVVTAVGKVADKNGNFPVEIYVETWDFLVWSFVDVSISANRDSFMVPINAVSIVDNNIWQVIVWDGQSVSAKRVTLGLVLWKYIEIKDQRNAQEQIVLTDIRNYDKEKMTIKLK